MNSISEQNARSYDDHADEWEESLKTNVAHKYMEKPTMLTLLPSDLQDASVLCVGVGSGEEIEEIQKRGASKIVGIDISEKLLERAHFKFPATTFLKKDMMEIGNSFEPEAFDLIYSSLAFHYSPDWDALLSGIYKVLKPGGVLLFSTHHPVFWGTKGVEGTSITNERGIVLTKHKMPLGNIEITYFNHPNEESIIESVRHAGFTSITHELPQVIDISEEQRSLMMDDERANYDKLKEKTPARPLFIIICAEKSK